MSSYNTEQPFDSIESAYDFMDVLAETILDAIKDLHKEHATALEGGQDRTAQAFELALYKAKTLNRHVTKSRLILNDLRSIRRLILSERPVPAMAARTARGR